MNTPLQEKKISGINTIGVMTLMEREIGRFLAVYVQTIIAPVVTTLLFYTVFALAFGGLARTVGDVPFLTFLAPGLIMMTMVQNAFANTSSSLIISKVQGNIVDVLMPPLSYAEFYFSYLTGGIVRGMMVGMACIAAIFVFVPLPVHSVLLIALYALLGTMMLSNLGILAGLWADKFDHMAAITNFIITPLTFLSGTFYSVKDLPEFWNILAYYNPFFYMIDGFRSGFTGVSDGSILIGLSALLAINLLLSGLSLILIKTGYKLKS